MVDHHPSENIVYLGSASVDNVFSGWQSTMSPRKECDIYILYTNSYPELDVNILKDGK